VERLAGDRHLYDRIAAMFADSAPALRAKLRAVVDARDAGEVSFTTHRLRGQASTLGADAVVAAVDALAEVASSGNWAAGEAAILEVDRKLVRFLEALVADRAPTAARV
jgi:HPt (histidine-containing phosphotransfer) domain-containing protein